MHNVVSNTGPLIALAAIGQLDLLSGLFDTILIPPAVQTEVRDVMTVTALAAANWIRVCAAQDTLAIRLLEQELDLRESEAIVLAQERQADLILIDERVATRKARAIGLRVIGTLGVLLMAKEKGLLPHLRPWLDSLNRAGFRMSHDLYNRVLVSAGEAGSNQDAMPK